MSSYSKCMSNILNISGRTTRWDFFLSLIVIALVTAVLGFLSKVAIIGRVFAIIAALYALISLVATITMTCRRLNDAGFNKLLVLIGLIPGLGEIALFVLCCFPSK